ncbi:MAG: YegP family protein [Tagaea sp.]
MSRYRIQVYRDEAGQYRWRLRAPNGRVTARGAEGYSRERDAERAARRLGACMALAKVVRA